MTAYIRQLYGRTEGCAGMKPCPFCGHVPFEIKHKDDPDGRRYFVRCGYGPCVVNSATVTFRTPEEAAEAWNTRNEEDETCHTISKVFG